MANANVTISVSAEAMTKMLRTYMRDQLLHQVAAERDRQDALWGEQNHPDVSDLEAPGLGEQLARDSARDRAEYWKTENHRRVTKNMLSWDGIMLEEVYEALSEEDPEKLQEELVQVAAVALAWIEAIQRRQVRSVTEIQDAVTLVALNDWHPDDELAPYAATRRRQEVDPEEWQTTGTLREWEGL